MKSAHLYSHKSNHHHPSSKQAQIRILPKAQKDFDKYIKEMMEAFELTNCYLATD